MENLCKPYTCQCMGSSSTLPGPKEYVQYINEYKLDKDNLNSLQHYFPQYK